jgi:glycosyltransferase involved in cell wall biosynthesis
MDKDLKVLCVATHIEPALGYGGVPTTAAVLTRSWSARGRKLELVCSDDSIAGRISPADVKVGERVSVSLYRAQLFKRWGFGLGALPRIIAGCMRADACYIHGIATWPVTVAAWVSKLLGKRYVVAPHGGLMPDHVSYVRRAKPHKWLYYKLLTFPSLRSAAHVHCTSVSEVVGVRQMLGDDAKCFIVPNGVETTRIAFSPLPTGDGLTLCFLGHIQREKGINAFIRAWELWRGPEERLLIAGRSIDPEYFKEFQTLVSRSKGAISYHGYLPRAKAMSVLGESHLLVLPSGLDAAGGMRENFGNVIAESLAAARPVIVAQGLYWDHVESAGVGFVFERCTESVVETLQRVGAMSRPELQQMGLRARRYAKQAFDPLRLGDEVWNRLAASHDGRSPRTLEQAELTGRG